MSDDKATPNGDYSARMRAVIDAEADPVREPYEARIAASAIVEKLRENDPELLRGWLDAQAEQLVWRFIVDRDCRLRAHERKTASRSVFRKSAEQFAAGESGAMTSWLDVPYTVEGNVRKSLGALTKDDLHYVADDYAARAAKNSFESAFFRALEKKVRRGTVADHFTEEQIAALRESISGLSAA